MRLSQIKSSRKRYLEEMKRTEEDIQPSDIEQWQKAEEKRQRKNSKRLRDDAMMHVRSYNHQ